MHVAHRGRDVRVPEHRLRLSAIRYPARVEALGRRLVREVNRARARVRELEPNTDPSRLFPPIEDEFGGYSHLFRGRVLNAGAGSRDISRLDNGELVNQDITTG